MRPVFHIVISAVLCGGFAASHAADPAQIAAKAGCTVCHSTDKKMIGPSYREVAAKYKGNADAVALLSAQIRKGSTGVWGKIPMPATDAAKLSDADLKAVVIWLLKTPT
jgi:cytochrome c